MRAHLPLALALFAFFPSAAGAQAQQRHVQRPVIDTGIRQVTTHSSRRVMWRAIVGLDRAPYLVVEQFRRARRGGDRLVVQHRFDDLYVGNSRVPMYQVRELRDLRWRSRGLDFVAESRRGDLSCRVDLRRRRRAFARCVQMSPGTPYPGPQQPPPPPVPPHDGGGYGHHDWSNDPAVIRACGSAFSGSDKEMACRELTRRAGRNPIPVIDACERAMDGDDSELGCLRTALMLPAATAPAVIDACERAMDGDQNEARCLDYARRAGPNPAARIAACADAADGDPAELACIRGARPRAR